MTKPAKAKIASEKKNDKAVTSDSQPKGSADQANLKKKEFGGRDGPEPTRYGDWEKNGIISDF